MRAHRTCDAAQRTVWAGRHSRDASRVRRRPRKTTQPVARSELATSARRRAPLAHALHCGPATIVVPAPLPPPVRLAKLLSLLVLCVAALARPMVAQAASLDGLAPLATRPQLDSIARRLEEAASTVPPGSARRASYATDAARIRQRLRDGDFRPGDQIVIEFLDDSRRVDTLQVRTGVVLTLRELPEIALTGVLRSELESHLLRVLATYIKDPRVRATPLTRLAILGEVQRPGFYAFASDLPLSEVIMRAGGPTGTADLRRVTVRRGATQLLASDEARDALQRGVTLDQLDLRPGDEISVGMRRQGFSQYLLPIITVMTGLSAVLVALR